MATKIKKGKGVDKWRKKKYFTILAPKVFQERELGQTMAYEPSALKDRRLTANLMVLLGNIKKQHVNITFVVDNVQGDTGRTRVQKYEVVQAALKRKVRRQRDRLDDSFKCVTKDNKLVQIKPLVITVVRTSSSVKVDLRKKLIYLIKSAVNKMDYDSFVMELINDKFQRDLARELRKIVPIRSVDIRVMNYLGEQESSETAAERPASVAEEKPEAKKESALRKAKEKPAEKVEHEVSETQSVSDDDQKAELSDKKNAEA